MPKNITKGQVELLGKPSDGLFVWIFKDHVKETAEEKKCKQI